MLHIPWLSTLTIGILAVVMVISHMSERPLSDLEQPSCLVDTV